MMTMLSVVSPGPSDPVAAGTLASGAVEPAVPELRDATEVAGRMVGGEVAQAVDRDAATSNPVTSDHHRRVMGGW
jgi:hypothetical protein